MIDLLKISGKQLFTFLFLAALILISGCNNQTSKTTEDKENARIVEEFPLVEIPLPDFLGGRDTEFSGLTWFNDQLILLPQYPHLMAKNKSPQIFGIAKRDILDYLKSKDESSLNFYSIDFIDTGLEKYSKRGSGYEAITFIDNTAYLTIEYMNEDKTESLIVKGNFDFESKTLKLDTTSLTKIVCEDKIFNLSNETLTQFRKNIIPIYEANGKAIESEPRVSLFNEKLKFQKFLSLPNIEYRITDATEADSSGKFWIMNYLYPKDISKLKPQDDYILKNFGMGKSHKKSTAIERLVELQIIDDEIRFSNSDPIYLQLLEDGSGRNWEGLAKLDNIGFLIATDTFPKTILAFVPIKLNAEQ